MVIRRSKWFDMEGKAKLTTLLAIPSISTNAEMTFRTAACDDDEKL